ncbi:MAG: UDP binding domain-containing protein [Candidatus Thorarchaeota archaeon]|nr:UDP binding domain-containing protein [Candidatus Thorarchaeota archaeon]
MRLCIASQIRINDFQTIHGKAYSESEKISELVDYLCLLSYNDLNEFHSTKITILGLYFKKDTDDVRESPFIFLIQKLLELGVDLHIHNPVARLPSNLDKIVNFHSTLEECTLDTDAAVLMTDWKDYETLGIGNLPKNARGKVLIDDRRLFTQSEISEGVVYHALGPSHNSY